MTDTALTALDLAHAAMAADPQSDAARLHYYAELADTDLFLLLEDEASNDSVTPRLFDLEVGRSVLVFDTEDRLAAFAETAAAFVALPGRVLADLLAGQGLGVGINLGVAASSVLLAADAVDWLVETLQVAPAETEARPVSVFAPQTVPPVLTEALGERLARSVGMALCACLAGVRYSDGRQAHLLGFIGAETGAEAALAKAAAEALTFSGIDIGEMDVAFFAEGTSMAALVQRHGLRFDLRQPDATAPQTLAPPGSDPLKPPILR